jgi:hypothetical protein
LGEKDELLRFGADLILETTSDLARELFPDPEGAVFSLSKQVKGF